MSTRIEDLIRQAQASQAQRAVAPERIRAALPARAARMARRRRNGTLVAAVGAAAVAVAITVPVVALRDSGGGNLGPAAPPAAEVGQPPAPIPVAALRYRPTWLPPGLGERSRLVSFGAGPGTLDGAVRSWLTDPVGADGEAKGPALELQLANLGPAAKPPNGPGNGGKPVDINGTVGYYHGSTGKSYVEWLADATTLLSISQRGLELSERDLLRAARSVRPDTAQLASPLRFGSLPDGLTMSMVEVAGDSAASWRVRVSGEKPVGPAPTGPVAATNAPGAVGGGAPAGTGARPDGAPNGTTEGGAPSGKPQDAPRPGKAKEGGAVRHLSVTLGTITSAPPGGEAIAVDGYPARFVTRALDGRLTLNYLVLDLGSGRLLTLLGQNITRQQLITTAEQVEVESTPDLSWLGGR